MRIYLWNDLTASVVQDEDRTITTSTGACGVLLVGGTFWRTGDEFSPSYVLPDGVYKAKFVTDKDIEYSLDRLFIAGGKMYSVLTASHELPAIKAKADELERKLYDLKQEAGNI